MKRKIWVWTSCIILLGAIGLWAFSNNGDQSSEVETIVPPSPDPALVTIPDIDPEPSSKTDTNSESPRQNPEKDGSASSQIPEASQNTELSISEPPGLQPEKEVTEVEVPLTDPTSTPKPTEPPKPEPKETDKPHSPDTPPIYEEKETQPNKPQDEPKAGNKNENGKVLVPGFGWVEQGGPSQGSKSESDGDWNKQIGTMD